MSAARIWNFASVAIIVAVLGLGWAFGVSPLLAQAAAANSELSTVQTVNQGQRVALAAMRERAEDSSGLEAELAALRESIPEGEQLGPFFERVAQIAATFGVTVESIIATEVSLDATAEATDDPAASTGAPSSPVTGQWLYGIPITVTFAGPHDLVAQAIGALQLDQRLFLVDGVELSAASETPGGAVIGWVFVLTDERPAGMEGGTADVDVIGEETMAGNG